MGSCITSYVYVYCYTAVSSLECKDNNVFNVKTKTTTSILNLSDVRKYIQ